MSSPDLKTFAKTHIAYEVRMLVQQVWALERLVPTRRGRNGELRLGPEGQALIEAALVHLRLLDEFLGGRGPNRLDARATDWLTSWGERGFLRADRDRVDAKVAHLAWRRATPDFEPADITQLADSCVDKLEVFLAQVDATPQSDHFDLVREQVEWYRARST